MSRFIQTATESEARFWLKDVAALASIGAFVWVVATWASIAQVLLVS
jgi:hypothetical protein